MPSSAALKWLADFLGTPSPAVTILTYLGFISVLWIAFKLWSHLWIAFRNFVWARWRNINYVKKYGEWAIITGATDGLGLEFAREYARRGLKILLISRNEDKLQSVADAIRTEFGVEVTYMVLDFTKLDDDKLHKIDCAIQGLDLGVLVNNVGVLEGKFKYLTEMSDDEVRDMLKVNVAGLVEMTRIVLPRMSRRHKGAIVNVASSAAADPAPLFAVYSATKAFVRWFSVAVSHEFAHRSVTVQCLSPYMVRTNMSSSFKKILVGPFRRFYPDPATYVKSAVATLPYARETTGYWLHGLQVYLMSLLGCDISCRAHLFVLDFIRDAQKLVH